MKMEIERKVSSSFDCGVVVEVLKFNEDIPVRGLYKGEFRRRKC